MPESIHKYIPPVNVLSFSPGLGRSGDCFDWMSVGVEKHNCQAINLTLNLHLPPRPLIAVSGIIYGSPWHRLIFPQLKKLTENNVCE